MGRSRPPVPRKKQNLVLAEIRKTKRALAGEEEVEEEGKYDVIPPEETPVYPLLSGLNSIPAYHELDKFLRDLPQEEQFYSRRLLSRVDRYYLLRYELGREDVEHPWLLARCIEVDASPNNHLDLWARDHYKSSIQTYAGSIQDILASHGDGQLGQWEREVTIGIFSHTRPIAKKFLRQIKVEFETNEGLKELFPDVLWEFPKKSAPKWSEDDGIVVKRKSNPGESTVEAWGLVDGQPTSRHFVICVYDDVVTLESVNTGEMIEKTTYRWEMSLNLSTKGGVRRYVGTRYDQDDTYQTMIERGVAEPRLYPATDNGQVTGKPVFLSQEAWDDKVKSTGAYTLSCQQLQNPTPDENAFFKQVEEETIRYYDPENPPQYTKNYAVTDGAVTKDDGDWTVHIPFGIGPGHNIYLWDLWRKQEDSDAWIEAQIHLARKYRPIKWMGEGGAIEKAVGPLRRRMMAEEKFFFTYDTLPSIADKETRAVPFQGLWNNGRIWLPYGKKWVKDFLLELRRFPNTTVDDQVDAAGMIGRMMDILYPGRAPKEKPPPNRDYSGWRQELEAKKKAAQTPESYVSRMGLRRSKPVKDHRTMGLKR